MNGILAYILSKKYAKQYADQIIQSVAAGFHFKGTVNTYSDLPTSPTPTIADEYIVKTSDAEHPSGIYVWDGSTWADAKLKGEKGDAGAGIAVGGTQGQILSKKSGSDYDTEWLDNEAIGSVHYTEDSKTEAEKLQARTNIGAQSILTSGVNIKTVDGESILQSGNIDTTKASWGNVSGSLSAQSDLYQELQSKAINSDVVHINGDEEIDGTKTFSSPVCIADGEEDWHAATLKQAKRAAAEKIADVKLDGVSVVDADKVANLTSPSIPVTDIKVEGTSILSDKVASFSKASSSTFGLIKADSKETEDTQAVRIDNDGKLWTEAAQAKLSSSFTVTNGIGSATEGKVYAAETLLIDIIKDMLTAVPTPGAGKVYWGVVDSAGYPPTSVDGFTSQDVQSTIVDTGITHSFTGTVKFYDAFAYPKSYGALIWVNQDTMPSINLLDTNYVRTEITVSNVAYYLYYNNTRSLAGTNTYTYKWK